VVLEEKLGTDFGVYAAHSVEDDAFIRKDTIGGRTQAFLGKVELLGKHRMIDVKSLYPYVMLFCEFPCGKYKHVAASDRNPDRLGVYRCDIINQDFGLIPGTKTPVPVVIALRTDEQSLNWDYRGPINNINLTTPEIRDIEQFGPGRIVVHEGIEWERKSSTLFTDFMGGVADLKNEQDHLKEIGSADYNASLRACMKLVLNSLGGKLYESSHDDYAQPIMSNEKALDFLIKTRTGTRVVHDVSGTTFGIGKLKQGAVFNPLRAKPSHLGRYVYANARSYMFNTVLKNYVVKYMDTDSALITEKTFQRFAKENDPLITADDAKALGLSPRETRFGMFEDETQGGFGEKGQISGHILGKKAYLLYGAKSAKDKLTKEKIRVDKFGFKGVKQSDTWHIGDRECKPIDSQGVCDKPSDVRRMIKHLFDGETIRIQTEQLRKNGLSAHASKHDLSMKLSALAMQKQIRFE